VKLLVTGASGFLGKAVVAAALRRGHTVRAMVRPASLADKAPSAGDKNLELVRHDLRQHSGLVDHVRGVEAVIHLAATKSGDFYTQFAGTVFATENLLAAMRESGIDRLILVSSFAVYDYRRIRTWSMLDETAPTEARPEDRDAYCQTKLLQESLVREAAQEHGLRYTVLRPGAVYGPGAMWTARIGMRIGKRIWVRTGASAPVPLTYVDNCADAILAAAESSSTIGMTLNIVDDEQPTPREYMAMLRDHIAPPPRVVRAPWWALRTLARCAWITNRLLFRGQAKLPGLLVPARLFALCKPLRYSNHRLKEATGWSPHVSLATAVEHGTSGSDFA
jgi:nucleoside-diphosphate-sugar epimerase